MNGHNHKDGSGTLPAGGTIGFVPPWPARPQAMPMDAKSINLLLIEDDPDDALLIREMLAGEGSRKSLHCEVVHASRLAEGLSRLCEAHFDVVLLDIDLPDSQGLDTVKGLCSRLPEIPVVVLTGRDDEQAGIEALQKGVQDYLVKGQVSGPLLVRAMVYAIERTETRTALKESERRYRELFEGSRDGFVRVDAQGRFVDANRAYCDMLGYSLAELKAMENFYQITPEQWRDWEHEEIWNRRLMQQGYSGIYVKEYIRKDGTVFPVELQSFAVFAESGDLHYLWGIARDIIARTQVEARLRQNEARFESLFQIAQYSASSIQDLLDFALERAIALSGSRIGYIYFYSEEKHEFTLNTWSKEVMNQCSIQNPQTVYELEKTGIWGEAVRQRRPVIVNDFAVPDPLKKGYPAGHAALQKFMTIPVFSGEQIVAVLGLANKQTDYTDEDIRQLQLLMDGVWKIVHQRELEAERSLLISAIEQATEIILIMDVSGAVQYVNPVTERITGYSREEVLRSGRFFYARFPEQSAMYDEVLEVLKNGATWTGRISEKKKDGTTYELEITITPICDESGTATSLISIGRDITQERRLEEQLVQSQKMEAIGTLAGGIAHDFNNILGGIIGYAEAAKEKIAGSHPGQVCLDQILKASDRAAALVKQILAFSRRTEQEHRPLRMHQVVREALQLLRASIPATIHILEHLCREGDVILGDPNQMHQVLMNLCTNAAHAMQDKGGVLSIELEPVYLNARDLCMYPELNAGSYVRLTVRDTGTGISPEIVDRIFDPFFTTKEEGRGTGMGLAVVHGIIKGHGGAISVESMPGRGTAFSVLLPCTDEVFMVAEEPASPLPMGSERILYVDDEESLVEVEQTILESLGYSVTACTSPQQAFELFCSRPSAFDLIITDHAMPHMSGFELAQRAIGIRQDIPIILCTGFSETISDEQAKSVGIREFMLKPMRREGIARAVRRVLDAG